MSTLVRRSAAGSPKLSPKLVVHWADRMLKVVGREEAELSVLLTNDSGIRSLNRDFRDKDRSTDVLSFHFDSAGLPSGVEAEWLLGDIAISLDTAMRQAQGRRRPIEEEVRWLLAHGILHLVGYDHATAEDKRVMVAMTRKLVRAAGDVPATLAVPTPTIKVTSTPRNKIVPATNKARQGASTVAIAGRSKSESTALPEFVQSPPTRAHRTPKASRRTAKNLSLQTSRPRNGEKKTRRQ